MFKKYAGYATPSTQWMPTQYLMQAPMQSVDDTYNLTGHMTYKNDGQGPRGISVMLPSPEAAAAATMQYTNMLPPVWK